MFRHFEEELKELKERLIHMGQLAEKMIQLSVLTLVERKEVLAEETFTYEEQVNKLQMEIDEKCLKLLACHQPAAIDLRLVTAAMKINSDLERIGDQAINISKSSLHLLQEPPLGSFLEIPKMAEVSQEMLRGSLEAFINKDVELAKSILVRDDTVDTFKKSIFTELLKLLAGDKSHDNISSHISLVLISRNLERIGDHATNIAEDVIFMVLGKDIRHHVVDIR
jgi:phosphate transport system protein